MSWLARSIANSLRIDGVENDDIRPNADAAGTSSTAGEDHRDEEYQSDDQQRGMKEDLSEFRETLTRQIWGVASFLAPPPNHQTDQSVADRNFVEEEYGSDDNSDEEALDSVRYSRFPIESEKCRSGSSDLAHMLPFRLEDQIGGAAGITEESLAFASNIAHHPETWLDFPLSEEEDIDDFDMSDAQYKHAVAVERLVPRLAALRIELCPAHMSKGYFWKVYFVLLHSRLNKQDAELLSTLQVVAARSIWMQELQKRLKPESYQYRSSSHHAKESPGSHANDYDPSSSDFPKYTDLRTSAFERSTYAPTTESETEKYPIFSSDSPTVDKSVIQEDQSVAQTKDKEVVAGPSYKVPVQQYDEEDDDDAWLEQHSEIDGYCGTTIFFGTDDDVTFSDLEDNDDCTMPVKSKPVINDSYMSTKAT